MTRIKLRRVPLRQAAAGRRNPSEPQGVGGALTPASPAAPGRAPRARAGEAAITAETVEILFVRHAAHADLGRRLTGRAGGVPLSPEGEAQAAALARALAAEGLSAVLSSPRERARRTAEAVARTCGLRVEEEPLLDEIDFGAWTGLAFADLAGDPLWEAWNRARGSARAPGGESMAEAAARIGALVGRLAAGPSGRRVALVTHADMIRGLVARVLGLPLDHLLRFEVGPASVSRVAAAPWGLRLLSLNEAPAAPPAHVEAAA